jgi:DNA polymerase III subunit epsilon
MTLFFDTETTSLINYGKPSTDAGQPHLVEIAALLVDFDWNIVEQFHAVVRPFGWRIPAEVSRIHGITESMATENGIPEAEALAGFMALASQAKARVAYNEPFDARILRIACKRYAPELAEWWRTMPSMCAMQLTRGVFKGKTPTLLEAYTAVLGKPMEKAHTAMGDTKACMDLFKALVKRTPKPADKPSAIMKVVKLGARKPAFHG